MSDYRAPLRDMQFVVKELIGLDTVAGLPGLEEASPDLVDAIMEGSAEFAQGVLGPLNRAGDKVGARWEDGHVTTPPGFRDAYRQFVDGGWNGLTQEPEFGGQGLPSLVATPVQEMWHSANMAFTLCPLLTQGACEALRLCGSEELKARFLHRMVTGEWTGTMNLTEPQAGSDLAALRSRAVRGRDHYRVFGQKIFITYGEHDYTDNIIHLVLARVEGAPEGVKGISLFVVPKFLVNDDGTLGARNDVRCVSIEHKLGIHGSPTAVLAYGDKDGAVGYLVGEENRGLEYMFIMMNMARFAVGLEGVGIAERAYQQAVSYARERVQGAPLGAPKAAGKLPIVHHPDVRRMLMTMKSQVEASRALTYYAASVLDRAAHGADGARRGFQSRADLLIPIVKGWSTELSVEIASIGVQVHGGMGYIEETGAAQHLRDARITTIYEGTTGIQSNDLLGRKVLRDQGAAMNALLSEVVADARTLAASENADCAAVGQALGQAAESLGTATGWLVEVGAADPRAAYAGAYPYLRLAGSVLGGWLLGRSAGIAHAALTRGAGDADFYAAKIATARFYADHVLAQASGLRHTVVHGARGALALSEAQF
jgi:3-(methylthio)propanoyl-CoA dehydrogenase